MHGFHMRAHIAAHGVGVFLNIFASRRRAGVLEHQTHLGNIGDDGQARAFPR